MKILTLNKQQEKKLLALCKEFFPECSVILFSKDQEGNYPEEDFISLSSDNGIRCNDIHWYQLCLTELPKRILNKIDEDQMEEYLDGDTELPDGSNPDLAHQVLHAKHPVDFLYKFVQECKRNKYFK